MGQSARVSGDNRSGVGRGTGGGPKSSIQAGTIARLLQRGEAVFRAGDRCRALYVVHSGAIKATMVSRAGEEQIIDFYLPGDILGLDALAEGHYACDAIALDTASVRVLSAGELPSTVDRLGSELDLLKQMSAQIARHQSLLLLMGHKNAEQRIATFLLDQSERHAARGFSPTRFTLPMPRTDIARYLGLAAETASRIFTRLRDKALVAVERNEVCILDREGLASLAARERDEPAPEERAAMH